MVYLPSDNARDIDSMLIKRELARRNYRDFLSYYIEVRRLKIQWNWHIAYLADLMQAVTARQLRRTIINIPPRFWKSTIISQLWQAWMIGRDDSPASSVFSAAATGFLAARDSRKTMDALRSDWYRAVFPGVTLTKENEVEWATAGGAERNASGAEGTVTGRGGDHVCIAAGQRVLLRRGWVPIEEITTEDFAATPLGWKKIYHAGLTGRKPTITLTAGAFSLRLTADHLCSTPEGWREAGTLHGGCVHALPQDTPHLSGLWSELPRGAQGGSPESILQPEVQCEAAVAEPHRGAPLPSLRQGVPSEERGATGEVLLPRLLQCGEAPDHDGRGEPQLEARQAGGTVPLGVPRADRAGPYSPAGCVPAVREEPRRDPAGGPPPERDQDRRFAGEPRSAVCPVPSPGACVTAGRGEEAVYDLTVDGAHCFYCEGILVHNCWDDLLLTTEAMSELVREKKNEWLGETLRSRINDPKTGTITGIMQRLHENDPTGYLIEQMKYPGADQYELVVIPNEAPKRTVVEFQGTVYTTREAGDLLHPARMGPTEVAAAKAAMRANYEGQYNQNPIKMEGGHLDPRRILRLQGSGIEIKSRLGLTPVFYIDFAATDKQINKNDPDFSCIEVWARDQLGRLIILDMWRQQTADYGVVARTLINMHRLWRPRFVKGERGALLNIFQPVLSQQMLNMGHFLTLEPLKARTANKMERSMAYQGALNAGLVCAPQDAPWFAAFESENRAYPNGSHDDTLDPAFDAAIDYQMLPRGEAPVVSPTDPAVILSDDIKRRLQEQIDHERNPEGEESW